MIHNSLAARFIGLLVALASCSLLIPAAAGTQSSDHSPPAPRGALTVDLIPDPHCQSTSADAQSFRAVAADIFAGLDVGDRLRVHVPGRTGDRPVSAIDVRRRAGDGPVVVASMWTQDVSKRLGVQSTDIFGAAANVFRENPQSDARHLIVVLLSRRPSTTEAQQARDLALKMRDSQAVLVIVGADQVVDELAAAAALGARIDPISATRPTAWIAMTRPSSTTPTTQEADPRIADLQRISEEQTAEIAAQEARQRALEQQIQNLRADDTNSFPEVRRLSDELQQARESETQAQGRADDAQREIERLQRRLHNLGPTAPARSDAGATHIGPFMVNVGAAVPSDLPPPTAPVNGDVPVTTGGAGEPDLPARPANETEDHVAGELSAAPMKPIEVDGHEPDSSDHNLAEALAIRQSPIPDNELSSSTSSDVAAVPKGAAATDTPSRSWIMAAIFAGAALVALVGLGVRSHLRQPVWRLHGLGPQALVDIEPITVSPSQVVLLTPERFLATAPRADAAGQPHLTISRGGDISVHAGAHEITVDDAEVIGSRRVNAGEQIAVRDAAGQIFRFVLQRAEAVRTAPTQDQSSNLQEVSHAIA